MLDWDCFSKDTGLNRTIGSDRQEFEKWVGDCHLLHFSIVLVLVLRHKYVYIYLPIVKIYDSWAQQNINIDDHANTSNINGDDTGNGDGTMYKREILFMYMLLVL